MDEIRLADFKDQTLFDYWNGRFRVFYSDLNTGAVRKEFVNSRKEQSHRSCGYGSEVIIGRWRLQTILVAMYVCERQVHLSINDQVWVAEDLSDVSVESNFPFGMRFSVRKPKPIVYEYRYLGGEEDFFAYIADHLNDSDSLKWFAYVWSAHSVGKTRQLNDLSKDTHQFLLGIDDPFDTDVNIKLDDSQYWSDHK